MTQTQNQPQPPTQTRTTPPTPSPSPSVSRSVLPMILHIPWDPAFELGMGYDYMGQTALLPVVPAGATVSSPAAASQLEYLYVTSQSDLDELVQASAEGSGSVQGIQVKASLEFTKSVRFSETTETLVFSWYSDDAHFERIAAPALDAATLALAATPDAFRLRNGDFFVSGALQRAEFHAVYQLSALKKQDLLSFKASAAVSSPDLFSASGSAAFTKAATDNHVSISATVDHTNSTSAPSLGSTPSLTPAQVLQMFTQFQADRLDGRTVAELTHYSDLAPGLSREVPVPPGFFADRSLLLGATTAYRGLLGAGLLPRDAATALKARATTLDATVGAEGPLYWQDPDQLTADRVAAESLAADARAATEFLHRARVLGAADGGASNLVGRQGGKAGIGTHGDDTTVPAGVTVREDTFDIRGDWVSGQLTKHVDKVYPGCTIVFITATNNWQADDGTLGMTGGIGSDRVHLGCTADLDRGLSWSFVVRYVESE